MKILDFGIAKALEADPDDDLTRVGGVALTPAYASPEQLAPGHKLSAASDVYQLGLVAYELLAGERPLETEDRERLRRGEQFALPVRGRWGDVPGPLRAVVDRALHPNPAHRYPDAEAFAGALELAVQGDGTGVAPPAPDDATLIMGHPAGDPLPSRSGSTPSVHDRWRTLPGGVRMAGTAVVVLLLLWAVSRVWSGGSTAGEPALAPQSTAELEEQFAPLYGEAAERIAEDEEP